MRVMIALIAFALMCQPSLAGPGGPYPGDYPNLDHPYQCDRIGIILMPDSRVIEPELRQACGQNLTMGLICSFNDPQTLHCLAAVTVVAGSTCLDRAPFKLNYHAGYNLNPAVMPTLYMQPLRCNYLVSAEGEGMRSVIVPVTLHDEHLPTDETPTVIEFYDHTTGETLVFILER